MAGTLLPPPGIIFVKERPRSQTSAGLRCQSGFFIGSQLSGAGHV